MSKYHLLTVSVALFVTVAILPANAQQFQDLDFESPNFVHNPADPAGSMTFSSAFPGWVGYYGTNVLTYIVPNFISFGPASISLWDTTNSGPANILEGSYGATLQGGNGTVVGGHFVSGLDASIAQTGLVPTNATFLLFKCRPSGSFAATHFSLSFAGQDLPYSAISVGANAAGGTYSNYVADLSGFAGQVGELRFTEPTDASGSGIPGPVFLDSIEFSSVPEPGPLALGGLGALLLAAHLWKKRRSVTR
jgi:hypothetical protein